MINRALLSAIALCFAAAGCDSQKAAEPPKPKAAAVIPLPPEAPKAAAASANQDAKPAEPMKVAQASAGGPTTGNDAKGMPKDASGKRGGCGPNKCMIKVRVTDEAKCRADYKPSNLSVHATNVKIQWVSEGGWLFDGAQAVELPTGGNQFSGHAGDGTATFSVTDENSDKNTYKYTIHLKKGTKKCLVDPSVVNGADYEDPNYP